MAFIKLSFKFEYWFCLINDNQDSRQNGSRLLVFSDELSIKANRVDPEQTAPIGAV